MKLSIIIPVYNVAPWLRACLDSVCAAVEKVKVKGVGGQRKDRPYVEVICVDDGSTDGCGAILDEYRERLDIQTPKHLNFRVLHQRNAGVSAARNAALEVAAGEWICFVDADDVVNERLLETYVSAIREHADAELVAVSPVRFADGMRPPWPDGAAQWRSFDCRKTVPADVYFLNLWICAFRADLLRGLQFGDLKIGEDRVFVSQVVERVGTAVVADWVGYGYRQRAGSALHSRGAAALVLDDICHYETLTRTILKSSKTYEPAIVRQLGMLVVEQCAAAYYRLPSAARDQVWEAWLAEMEVLSGMAGLRPYVRAVMKTVVRTRSKALARILIWGILWLKLHGVNRHLVVTKK